MIARALSVALGCALVLVPGAPSAAQVHGALDVGGVSVRYGDSLDAVAGTVTPELQAKWRYGTLGAQGTFSQFRSGGWATQGTISSSVFSPLWRSMIGELSAAAGGTAHESGWRTGQVVLNGRAHLQGNSAGAFVGAGMARPWDGRVWRDLLLAEAGAWTRLGAARGMVTVSPVASTDSLRYADAQLAVSLPLRRLDFSGVVGARAGDRVPAIGNGSNSWASMTVAAWVAPQLALVGSGGSYPVDPTQGFPGGRFISLSLRLAFPAASAPSRQTLGHSAAAQPGSGAVPEKFVVESGRSGLVTIRVRAPMARAVQIMGDFNSWTAAELTPDRNGWWMIRLAANPGTYEMNVRIDGQNWVVPPGLLALHDEFGGSTGLLTIH